MSRCLRRAGVQYCDLLLSIGDTVVVAERARQALAAAERDRFLLGIGLHHLSLGRAQPEGSSEADAELAKAVARLRDAGTRHHLPRALLARAAYLRHSGRFHDAQAHLDEVRTLATRAAMRLYLIDFHLEQARLFMTLDQSAEAQRHGKLAALLIEQTGYHRRDAELAKVSFPTGDTES